MSSPDLARRTDIEVFFAGSNITSSMQKYLLSLTYTDNEEDETDDLQIKLQDRSGIWRQKWLNYALQAAAENTYKREDKAKADTQSTAEKEEEPTESIYKVTATSGLAVRSRAGTQYFQYGTLAYGTTITVMSISNGWANFMFDGKNAYVNASYLQFVAYVTKNTSSGSSTASNKARSASTATTSAGSSGGSNSWAVGDSVIVTGTPQYTSYGTGTPGIPVTKYKGSITYLNLASGVPYPIHVGSLGWFAESVVQKVGGTTGAGTSTGNSKDIKGLHIQAAILQRNWKGDGKDRTLNCGQFELDSIVAQGPPATVTIKGTSLPYSSNVRQTQKSKSWESYTLSGIAGEIAEKSGMACMFQSALNPFYNRVEQYRCSDIVFLQQLCRQAGCSLKVSNNIIIIFDQAEYENKSAVKTIYYGQQGGYTSYKLSTDSNDTYTSCRVSCVTSSGIAIEGIAYIDDYNDDDENNQCLEIKQQVANVTEAQSLAEKMLRLHNKYALTATFSFPGDPTLLAGCVVALKGWGAWDGKYIISQARHKVDGSGYTTQINLRRALAADIKIAQSAENTNTNTITDEVIDRLAREVIRGDWGNGAERKRKLTAAGYDYSAVQARVNEILYG